MAGADRIAQRRRRRNERDHARARQVQDLRLALAGRFAAEGVDGLLRDRTRPSRIPKLDPSVAERVVALTMEEPPSEATHWTGAAMAEAAGGIWRAHGLQPHRVRQSSCPTTPPSSTSCALSSGASTVVSVDSGASTVVIRNS